MIMQIDYSVVGHQLTTMSCRQVDQGRTILQSRNFVSCAENGWLFSCRQVEETYPASESAAVVRVCGSCEGSYQHDLVKQSNGTGCYPLAGTHL